MKEIDWNFHEEELETIISQEHELMVKKWVDLDVSKYYIIDSITGKNYYIGDTDTGTNG